jgi:hypothetical protein
MVPPVAVHVTLGSILVPSPALPLATKGWVAPDLRVTLDGETLIDASSGADADTVTMAVSARLV